MTVIQIPRKNEAPAAGIAVLTRGFRPFFLGAALCSVVTMIAWMAAFVFGRPLSVAPLSPSQWHAHEMIFGYAGAVIAGFLLTAVENWTGRPTLRSAPLALLFSFWAGARGLFLFGTRFLYIAGALDLFFLVALSAAVLNPIIRTRQWKQMAIAAKLTLLAVGQLLFLLGVAGRLESGVKWGLYGGFYLVIGLILTMGARVMPAFIQNGVDEEIVIARPAWIAFVMLTAYLLFFLSNVFLERVALTTLSAAFLFVATTARLIVWHTHALWKKPLLWSLYLSFAFIDLGFLLFALKPWLAWPDLIPIHAMAVGGIGLVTMGMMGRVSLGHSGRSVFKPPRSLAFAVALLVVAALVRTLAAILNPGHYTAYIGVAMMLWIAAFILFILIFGPMLLKRDAMPTH